MNMFAESTVEEAVLEWSHALNYSVLHGPNIAPEERAAERISYSDVILADRLRAALSRLNPTIPADALDEAFHKITRTETPSLIENNRRFHRMLIDGIDVEYHANGRIVSDKVWLIDFDHPEQNDWLAVNQFTVTEGTQLDIALGVTSNDFTLEVYFIPDIVPLREGREEVCDCGLCQHYFYGTAITKDAAKQLDCKCSPAVRGFESRRPFQQHITNNTHLYYDGDEPKPTVYFRRFAVCPIMEPCGVEQIGVILLTSMQEEEFVEDVLDTLEFLAATVSNFQKEYNRCFCKNYE